MGASELPRFGKSRDTLFGWHQGDESKCMTGEGERAKPNGNWSCWKSQSNIFKAMLNETKTPRTDALEAQLQEGNFLKRVKKAITAHRQLELETIQLGKELEKKEQELHSIIQLCRPTPLSIGHPLDYVKWLREDRDRKKSQLSELQADKERLDWLEKCYDLQIRINPEHFLCLSERSDKNIRLAIDSARKEVR